MAVLTHRGAPLLFELYTLREIRQARSVPVTKSRYEKRGTSLSGVAGGERAGTGMGGGRGVHTMDPARTSTAAIMGSWSETKEESEELRNQRQMRMVRSRLRPILSPRLVVMTTRR